MEKENEKHQKEINDCAPSADDQWMVGSAVGSPVDQFPFYQLDELNWKLNRHHWPATSYYIISFLFCRLAVVCGGWIIIIRETK